jgi:hypothetical protein
VTWRLVELVLDDPQYQRFEGGSLLVLIALAEWANKDGIAWPGVDAIAKRTRLKGRQIFRILGRLGKEGVVLVESGGGRGRNNRYRFALNRVVNPVADDTVSDRETLASMTPFANETLSSKTLNPVVEDSPYKEEPLLTSNSFVETQTSDFQLSNSEPEPTEKEETAILQEIWAHYLKTIGKKPSLYSLNEKRKSMGRARFRECCGMAAEPKRANAVGMMKLCVDRLKESAWHNGSNPSGKRYLDWEILFRSNEQMVKWLDDDNFAHREAAS